MANTYTEAARRAAHPDPLTANLPADLREQPAADLLNGKGGNWRDEALCAEVDQDLFFPEKGASNAEALSVCGACPVRIECLAEALDGATGTMGVWGGSSDNDRKHLRQMGWTGELVKAYAAANDGAVPLVTVGARKRMALPLVDCRPLAADLELEPAA